MPFHEREQGQQVAKHPAALAAHEFGDVRVFLLRHDGGAGAPGIAQFDKAVGGREPQDQFLGEARQVHHNQAGRGAKLDGKVAVAHGVQ